MQPKHQTAFKKVRVPHTQPAHTNQQTTKPAGRQTNQHTTMHTKNKKYIGTLLSSQTSHPPQQSPHKPCRNHHKATRPTLPHQPRNHKTTIPEPASRTSQPHHHQSSSPENHTGTLPRRQTRQENIPNTATTKNHTRSPQRPNTHYTHPHHQHKPTPTNRQHP